MALAPSRTKYRKSQKGSRAGNAKRGNTLAFGEFGLQSLSRGPMTGQQIEAARVTISRHFKRKGKLWIRIFPHKPVTKKPAEVRQGQGKGTGGVLRRSYQAWSRLVRALRSPV
jgi:large subunit ribosomal protein L16